MMDAIYGCDTCRTTIGRAGCPTHRDQPKPTPGVNIYITTCIHGLDLRIHPRCYLCRPDPDALREALFAALEMVDLTAAQLRAALEADHA